jgi:hypothetical protein
MANVLKVFLDCDPLIYEIGFVSQDTYHEVVWEEEGDRQLKQGGWNNGNDKLEYFRALKADGIEYVILSDEKNITPVPVGWACFTMKKTLLAMQRDIAEHYGLESFDVHMILLLTGGGNFRETVAKQRPYKGNRKQERPVHYQALRDYVVKHWAAKVVDGMEADDECSIMARGEEGIVATIDKDLDQIPGKHYDYKRKVFYEISPYEAMEFFYKQVISGDAVDNIPGAYKIGQKTAEKRLSTVIEELALCWEDSKEAFEQILWEEVLTIYEESTNKKGCPYAEDYEAVALETARLVKLLEYEDQLWTPPGEYDESIQEYLNNVNE